jgi:WD40 repeat protein
VNARVSLSAWRRHYPGLKAVFSHDARVAGVAFSRDGQTVLTAGEDGTVRRWDAATGQLLGQPLQYPGVVEAVAFSPDGKAVALAGGLSVRHTTPWFGPVGGGFRKWGM